MNRPTMHVMVGLPCSGKTTTARELAVSEKALLLTPDPWQIALFGDDTDQPEHDARHDTIEKLLLEMASQALSIGTSVILDYGFWGRDERDALRQMAKEHGARFHMHYLDVPMEELLARMEKRNRETGSRCFTIRPEQMIQWSGMFQRPTADELALNDEA